MNYLTVYQFDEKVRLGSQIDGGYVIANIPNYDCYISAGVSDEESFSRDFIPKYGMTKSNSFAFDGTIRDYPWQYTREITFVKKNIGTVESQSTTNLVELISNYNNIFLKMDIEGGEYPWLSILTQDQLLKFKQITMEFHGIHDDSYGCSFDKKKKYFEKLAETHYLVHAHGNNWAPATVVFDVLVPNVIELTYVRKSEFEKEPSFNQTALPMKLDRPNKVGVSDYNLTFPPFHNS